MNNNQVIEVFKRLKDTGKKAFIPYITAGDPNLKQTLEILDFFANNGADIIELGVPFSDPMADGPVIQRAMERALKSGTTLKKILQTIKDFKDRYSVPIVLMGYYNPFWAFGIDDFAKAARDAGVDAVLTVDLPPEEAKGFTVLLKNEGITPIFLATPVTDEKRLLKIRGVAAGFIYFVSVTGVTGERYALPEDTEEKVGWIKRNIELPLVLGFGISSPKIIHEFYLSVDGFVVGSALVRRWERACLSEEGISEFRIFFIEMAQACHRE